MALQFFGLHTVPETVWCKIVAENVLPESSTHNHLTAHTPFSILFFGRVMYSPF